MTIGELLQIKKGITAAIGSGGKTTLLNVLARELKGSVILCTTTHIRKPEFLPFFSGDEDTIAEAIQKYGKICIGTEESATGKIIAPAQSFDTLRQLADYILVEADGAKMLPLKAHREYEPQIPAGCENTICVVGSSGFGRKIKDVCHRPELFCQRSGLGPEELVTPAAVSRVLQAEQLRFDRIFVNQCDSDTGCARELAALLPFPIAAGALQRGTWEQICSC